jgi:hypothetical protein
MRDFFSLNSECLLRLLGLAPDRLKAHPGRAVYQRAGKKKIGM